MGSELQLQQPIPPATHYW